MSSRFVRVLLVLIVILLGLNLVVSLRPTVRAAAEPQQILKNARTAEADFAYEVACSSDGNTVFVSDRQAVYRSRQGGSPGTWELVLR